jgi:hypothetical protein
MLLPARKSAPSVRLGATPVSQAPVQAWSCARSSGRARFVTTVSQSRYRSSGFKIVGSSNPGPEAAGIH